MDPVISGWRGRLLPSDRNSLQYGGAYLRPLVLWPEAGDLILGALIVDSGDRRDYEWQGEYRLPGGLGIGAGVADTALPGTDVVFGKVTYRDTLRSWNYILEMQVQEFGKETSPGGYAALYDDPFMVVGGTDGEQWRVTAGYVAPVSTGLFRPAVELLYVDNSIGELVGPRSWFGDLTLNYDGGCLSHPARLGRAMGPQGVEFGNPLGLLTPTWNRRLEGGNWADSSVRAPSGSNCPIPVWQSVTKHWHYLPVHPRREFPGRAVFRHRFLGTRNGRPPLRRRLLRIIKTVEVLCWIRT